MFSDLKNGRLTVKEEIASDIRELGKRTRDIEVRYDNLIRKSSLIEKAEAAAEKSGRNIESINGFLKDLDNKKKEIESSFALLDTVKTEYRELSTLYNIISSSK